MKEPDSIFQEISIRRRVLISISILTMLIIVIGLYGFIAILESNERVHKSVLEGQTMANAIDTARLSQVHFKKQVQEWKNILLRDRNTCQFCSRTLPASELTLDHVVPRSRGGRAHHPRPARELQRWPQ